MMKTKRYAGLGMVAALVLGACLLAAAKPAPGMSTADQPSAILTWPYIKVSTAKAVAGNTFDAIGSYSTVDTRLHLVNHSSSPKLAHCFYIDATVSGTWRETDFFITLTPGQPISWLASEGLRGPITGGGNIGVCTGQVGKLCRSSAECSAGVCLLGNNNNGTAVPPVPDPFEGALKCVQLDPNAAGGPAPDDQNSLTGMATIVHAADGVERASWGDVEKYHAIGLKAIAGANDQNGELVIGGEAAEYEAAPSTLIVNHLFDDSINPLEVVAGGVPPENRTVHTYLTLIPVSDNFLTGTPGRVTAQFLVFNEFEQRFSTSILVPCVYTSKLSRIDTTSPNRSIWSAHVAGTIAGQTRVRGVGTTNRSLLALARLYNDYDGRADYAVHQQGDADGDQITLP